MSPSPPKKIIYIYHQLRWRLNYAILSATEDANKDDHILPETNKSHLKMDGYDGWNTNFLFGSPIFRSYGEPFVLGSVHQLGEQKIIRQQKSWKGMSLSILLQSLSLSLSILNLNN